MVRPGNRCRWHQRLRTKDILRNGEKKPAKLQTFQSQKKLAESHRMARKLLRFVAKMSSRQNDSGYRMAKLQRLLSQRFGDSLLSQEFDGRISVLTHQNSSTYFNIAYPFFGGLENGIVFFSENHKPNQIFAASDLPSCRLSCDPCKASARGPSRQARLSNVKGEWRRTSKRTWSLISQTKTPRIWDAMHNIFFWMQEMYFDDIYYQIYFEVRDMLNYSWCI